VGAAEMVVAQRDSVAEVVAEEAVGEVVADVSAVSEDWAATRAAAGSGPA